MIGVNEGWYGPFIMAALRPKRIGEKFTGMWRDREWVALIAGVVVREATADDYVEFVAPRVGLPTSAQYDDMKTAYFYEVAVD